MLMPDGRSVFVAGSNEGGQLGLPPSDDWEEDAELRLPEPAVALAHGVAGSVVRTRSGAVYGWGAARPGPELAPGLVGLPGPATLIVGGMSGPCAFIPAHGLWCWGGAPPGTAPPLGSSPVSVPSPQRGVVDLATSGRRLCMLMESGELRCLESRPSPDGPDQWTSTRTVASDVHAVAGGFNYLCIVEGSRRALRCWAEGAELADFELERVASLGIGEGTGCAVAGGWLYCWGASLLRDGWIAVGPHGVDPDTVPEDEVPSVWVPRPRRVLPVTGGTTVMVFGMAVCLRRPDGTTLCDRLAQHTPLTRHYGIESLPVGQRPFPGVEVLSGHSAAL